MVNQNITNAWKAEHFITYLYLAIADSDSNTTSEEIDMAKRKINALFKEYFSNSAGSSEQIVNAVLSEIMEHTEQEKTDLINNMNKKFHLDDDVKTDIVSDLTDIISSDDQVQASEHYMLSFVRVLLSKN